MTNWFDRKNKKEKKFTNTSQIKNTSAKLPINLIVFCTHTFNLKKKKKRRGWLAFELAVCLAWFRITHRRRNNSLKIDAEHSLKSSSIHGEGSNSLPSTFRRNSNFSFASFYDTLSRYRVSTVNVSLGLGGTRSNRIFRGKRSSNGSHVQLYR